MLGNQNYRDDKRGRHKVAYHKIFLNYSLGCDWNGYLKIRLDTLCLLHSTILYTTLYNICANLLVTLLTKVGKSEYETAVGGKELNTGLSTEVQWLGLSTVLKTVSSQ